MIGIKGFLAACCTSALWLAHLPDPPADVFDNVLLTDEQIEHATAKVHARYCWQIERIHVGLVHFPLDDVGIRYDFKAEVLDTYAIRRSALVTFACEKRDISTPGTARKTVARVAVGEFEVRGIHSWIERVFALKKATVYLRVPDNMTYAQAVALMQVIEADTFKRRGGVPSVSLLQEPINMSSITGLSYDRETETIRVTTREARFGGCVLSFVPSGDGFELIDLAYWYA